MVVEVWQTRQKHWLGSERVEEFMQRPETVALALFTRDELDGAARETMRVHDGRLLVADWFQTAVARRARRTGLKALTDPDERRVAPEEFVRFRTEMEQRSAARESDRQPSWVVDDIARCETCRRADCVCTT